MSELILTTEMLRLLRASDEYITFRASWVHGEPGESQIVGKCKDAENNSYTKVVLDAPSWLEYGSSLVREHSHLNAYASVSTPRFHELWQTFLAIARKGDDLRMVWSANGHGNQNVREAGLNVDDLYLELRRNARRLRLHIDSRICPANTARMFTAGAPGTYIAVSGPWSH